jgi:CheY-like chemotaxis protein
VSLPERRVLIVDDDGTFRAVVHSALVRRGWRVDEAETAADAEALLAERRYEVIVLDFSLPDRDGVECLERWRATGLTTPVLCLTGAESDTILEALVLAGAHDVVGKQGLDTTKLLDAIEATGGPAGYPEEDLPPVPVRAPSAPGPFERKRHDGKRALVVDDALVARAFARRTLQSDGWSVTEAASATAALELDVASFDLLVVDYLLPDFDGATLIQEAREAGAQGAVLAITAHGSDKVALELVAAGASALLSKEGLDADRLRAAVEEALGA